LVKHGLVGRGPFPTGRAGWRTEVYPLGLWAPILCSLLRTPRRTLQPAGIWRMLRRIAPRDPGRPAGERILRSWRRGASGGCQVDAAADRMLSLLRGGGGVLRLWSSVASGGYHTDAVADRMLSLLRENEPSACRAEFGACMRTGVSEDNSRK
jgi:hypothetical protein